MNTTKTDDLLFGFVEETAKMSGQLHKQLDLLLDQRKKIDEAIQKIAAVLQTIDGATPEHIRVLGMQGVLPQNIAGLRFRSRLTREKKLVLGKAAYDFMKKQPKKKHTAEELEHLLEGYPIRDIYETYNEEHPKQTIVRTGERALTRYHVS